MDPQPSSQPDPNRRLEQLEREEHKLWRYVLLFLALLATAVGAVSWERFDSAISLLKIVPVIVVLLVFAFAAFAATKRNEISKLQGEVRGMQQAAAAPATEYQLEQLAQVIQKSQRGFRDLIDSIEDVALGISLDGTIRAANRACANLLQQSFPDFVGHRLDEFLDKPEAKQAAQILQRILERQHWEGVVEVRLKAQKELRYFECSIHTILKEGHVEGLSLLGRDVTHQRERESRFTELFESLHEAVYFTTPEGRVLDANMAMVRMLGYENKAALLASNAADHYLHPQDRRTFVHDLEQMNTLRDREVLLRKRDGTPVFCLESSSAITDAEGNVVRFQGTLVDITSRRQIENRLQQQEEFNRRLIECFPDAILALDHEYRCTFASPRVREMLGFAPEELAGKVFNTNAHSEALVKLLRDALSGTLVAGTTEFEMQRRDGVWRWLRCSASQLLDSNNELVGVVASLRDVTEAQQMEQQLLHSERLAAMGQMVDGFAHELNNPLTAIMGGVELLDAKRLDEASSRHLQLLKQQVRRAAEIVQNLLFFSRPPAPGKTRVNINDLIQRTLMLHQYSLRLNNISVDFIPDTSTPTMEADANQLMQVFLNLIVNAEQAIRDVRDRGTIRIRIGHSDTQVSVTFQDDGPGISSESVPKIFDPFYSTKRPGRGLGMGLSVAMAIVKSCEGKIEFTPAPGGGAAFTIILPVVRSTSAHSVN